MMKTGAITILMIDDNPGDTFLVEQILRDAQGDYHLKNFPTLAEGIHFYRQSRADLILLDLSLADSSGFETFERLKSAVKDIPIIILTGMNDQKIAVQAVRVGAQDYLLKDELSESLLTRSIKYALERFGAEEKRRWLENKLLYSQKLESLSVLSGGVAHNFNQMLTAIIGNSEIAMKKMSPEASAYKNLQRIYASAQQAAELSNQMLAYSGRGRFEVKSLNLSELIEELKPIILATASSKINLIYQLDSSLPAFKADVSQLKQLILTLLINSVEAIGGSKGEIQIKTQKGLALPLPSEKDEIPAHLAEGKYLVLEITDNGSGIAPENMARVFEPFFTTKFTGRGLGLAAAQGIARGHGGWIQLENRAGGGVRARVYFPQDSAVA